MSETSRTVKNVENHRGFTGVREKEELSFLHISHRKEEKRRALIASLPT